MNCQTAQLQQLNKPLSFYPIKGKPEYLITKEGIVLSLRTNKLLRWHKESSGYFSVPIRNGKAHFMFLHRLLAEMFIPNPKNLPEVNHIDGNKENNSLDNLEWVTGSENIRHAFSHNLCVTSNAVDYSELDLIVDRLLHEPETTWSSLKREFHISDSSTLRKLVKRDLERRGLLTLWDKVVENVNKKARDATRKQVRVTAPDGSEYYFNSQVEAARWLGVHPSAVCTAIKKETLCLEHKIERVKTN